MAQMLHKPIKSPQIKNTIFISDGFNMANVLLQKNLLYLNIIYSFPRRCFKRYTNNNNCNHCTENRLS